jgi:hypothetical protein
MGTSSEIGKHSPAAYRFDRVAVILAGLVVFCAAASISMADWMPRLDVLERPLAVGGSAAWSPHEPGGRAPRTS